MIVIGIDPGLTGAMAMLDHGGGFLHCQDLPVMARMGAKAFVQNQVNGLALAQDLMEWTKDYDKNEIRIFLETPIAFPGQHVAVTASSFLTAGIIEGVITARFYPHTLVAPKDWKKAMKLTQSKEQARAMAIRLFPGAPLSRMRDHNRAEALLIAKYGHGVVS